MVVTRDDPPAYPQFRHKLEAMLAQMAREQRELFGPILRRIRRREAQDAGRLSVPGPWSGPDPVWSLPGGRRIDFSLASPITSERRQSDHARVPHFDFKHITRTVVPRSKAGELHPRYPDITGVAADHHRYVTDGALSLSNHYDYVTRHAGGGRPGDGISMMDVLDFADDHYNKNLFAVLSNIGDTPLRQRSLFEAAERCERQAQAGTLTVSTEHTHGWVLATAPVLVSDWMKEAAKLLTSAHTEVIAQATRTGKPPVHRKVTLCKVGLEQAYDRLAECDRTFGEAAQSLPNFEQGRSGRIQTRFVAELPRSLPLYHQNEIMRRFCKRLDDDGWMYVAAIHRPDPHNTIDNMHMHIDCYDRPSKWLDDEECWDFEYRVKANSRWTFPKRQNKISHTRGEKGGPSGISTARDYYKGLRAAYVDIVNDVVDGRAGNPFYVTGTYRENNIALTPLKHLGNQTIAREKQGFATKGGTRNAHIMIKDRLGEIRRRWLEGLTALGLETDRRLQGARSTVAQTDVHSWRALQVEALDLAVEAAVTAVARDALVSRAEAVAANAHVNAPETVAAARDWIEAVDAITDPQDTDRLRNAVQSIRARANQHLDDANANDDIAPPALRYRARSNDALAPPAPKYRKRVRQRLLDWLDEHGQDADYLSLDDGVVALGLSETRQAIDRLLRLFIDDAEVQERLYHEWARRKRLAISEAVQLPEPTAPNSARPAKTLRVGTVRAAPAVPVVLPPGSVRSKGLGDVGRAGAAETGSNPSERLPTKVPAQAHAEASDRVSVERSPDSKDETGKVAPSPRAPTGGLRAQAVKVAGSSKADSRKTGSKGPRAGEEALHNNRDRDGAGR